MNFINPGGKEREVSKKYKVLFISHAGGWCGSEQALHSLLKGLNRDMYEPVVVVPYHGPLEDNLSRLGIRTITCPKLTTWMPYKQEKVFSHIRNYYPSLLKRIMLIGRIIEEESIDLVFSNELLLLEGCLAARLKGRPHIYYAHNVISDTYFRTYLPVSLIKWLTLHLTDKLILVSNKQLQEMFKKPLYESKKLGVVVQGFDTQYFAEVLRHSGDFKLEAGINKGSSLIALIATFVRHKGQGDFIRAAYIVRQSLPNTAFLMIGRGDERYIRELEDLISSLKLQNNIFIVNFVEDIASVYNSLDVLVCASSNETFGRTVVEAMLAGKPVVSTKCGGPEEIIINEMTGLLVPQRDPIAMANAILMILRDKELSGHMGQAGRKRAMETYSLERYARSVEAVIEECIDEGRRDHLG